MKKLSLNTVKVIALCVIAFCMAIAGFLFREHRTFKETVVVSEGCTEVKKLSDYSDAIKPGSVNDCNVYIYDSGVEGGTFLIIGGSHPEEPAGPMVAQLLAENLKVTKGKVFIITRANNSASTITRIGEAYPRFATLETNYGTRVWRMGQRHAAELDSWPDPEVYIHYPSTQNLANVDIRNLNRNWPGKKDGLLSERTAFAIMELIRNEGVDYTLDYHEAELEYSVENTLVAHDRGFDVASMVSMTLTADTFDVPIGMEFSPSALRGLSHRDIGDHSDAASFLVEVAEPMLDRIRGVTDEKLLMEGKDIFVIKAGEHGLLYAPMDENGWPIEKRVARHVATTTRLIEMYSMMHPDQEILVEGIPTYQELLTNLGAYYRNPATADPSRIYFD